MFFNNEHAPVVQQILDSLANMPDTWYYDDVSGDLINENLGVEFRELDKLETVKILVRNRGGWLAVTRHSKKAIWKAIAIWFNRDLITTGISNVSDEEFKDYWTNKAGMIVPSEGTIGEGQRLV